MDQKSKNLLIYGTINILLYVITPTLFIIILSNFEYFDFNLSFFLMILIFGLIGAFISVMKYFFPEDSNLHHLISIGSALFSGVYLFYIFGGFSLGIAFGSYRIETSAFQVELGLQIIAWSLLIGSLMRTISAIIKLYEKNKDKIYSLKIRKEIKLTQIFSTTGIIIYILIAGYLIFVALNGSQISFLVQEDYDIGYDSKGTPLNLEDDTINISIYFDVINKGLFPILNTEIEIDIYTLNTSDATQLALPNNTKIGEAKDLFYDAFKAKLVSKDKKITIDIFNEYIPGLILYDADLDIKFSLETFYAGIFLKYNTSEIVYWDANEL
ncbi:MAG: hypothetical protein ACQERB_15910 [Promethearchaeati archaeon]